MMKEGLMFVNCCMKNPSAEFYEFGGGHKKNKGSRQPKKTNPVFTPHFIFTSYLLYIVT